MTNNSGASSMNVVARLGGGHSFGEVALLHHSKRTATIESDSQLCMLVINRADFFNIFFYASNGKEPEYISFCREIDFLRHWPVDILLKNPGMCMFHYYKRGSIVIADSLKNDWIYIVKTGTCNVVKRLQHVEPERTWDQQLTATERLRLPLMELSTCEIKSRTNSNFANPEEQKECSVLRDVMQEFFSSNQILLNDNFIKLNSSNKEHQRATVTFHPSTEESNMADENHTKNRRHMTAPSDHVNQRNQSQKRTASAALPSTSIKTSQKNKTKKCSEAKAPCTTENLPCFVLLRSLKPKDAFGLEDVCFEDEDNSGRKLMSVSVVSNGAEIIMLSRNFFETHANEKTKQFVREHVWPYPTENTLQSNLQEEVNWELYRKELVKETVNQIEVDKSLKDL